MMQRLRAALDKFGVVRQIFRQGYLRHRSLMMEDLLNPLKRSHQTEKRLVVLARDDAPVGKDAAVQHRKSVGTGKSGSVRVDIGGRRLRQKTNQYGSDDRHSRGR